jgi:hypothetical protein
MVAVSSMVFVAMDMVKRGGELRPAAAQAAQQCAAQPLAELRDAVRDIAPAQAAETSMVAVDGSGRYVEGDHAAYVSDSSGDEDVQVSPLYGDKAAAERTLPAAAGRLTAAGRSIVFSCRLRDPAGGFFYVIRSEKKTGL